MNKITLLSGEKKKKAILSSSEADYLKKENKGQNLNAKREAVGL